jgi:2-polyprenyl-3-methyl-5-hydroxy-6-metoxy-1,4-benzoquinol methylase
VKRIFIYILILISFQTQTQQSLHEIFSNIYNQRLWGANAQGAGCSGSGSTLETTQEYRNLLELILDVLQIKSVVDLGCGDWEFSRVIPWGSIEYKGFDVVAHVIESNIQKYSKKGITFAVIDATKEELPAADLLICKDVLQHLSNLDVAKIITQFKKYKYCIITNDVYEHTLSSNNADIERGDYRPLDITAAPFYVNASKLLVYRSGYVTKQVLLICNS